MEPSAPKPARNPTQGAKLRLQVAREHEIPGFGYRR
jgi:hypothetical protein